MMSPMGVGCDEDKGVGIAAVAEEVGNCEVPVSGLFLVRHLSGPFSPSPHGYVDRECGVGGSERTSRLRERSRWGAAESKVSPCQMGVRD